MKKTYYDLIDTKTNKIVLRGGFREIAEYFDKTISFVKYRTEKNIKIEGCIVRKSKNQKEDDVFKIGDKVKVEGQIYIIEGTNYENIIVVSRGDKSFAVYRDTMQIADKNPVKHSRNGLLRKGLT